MEVDQSPPDSQVAMKSLLPSKYYQYCIVNMSTAVMTVVCDMADRLLGNLACMDIIVRAL
jgi:hypothetical protein